MNWKFCLDLQSIFHEFVVFRFEHHWWRLLVTVQVLLFNCTFPFFVLLEIWCFLSSSIYLTDFRWDASTVSHSNYKYWKQSKHIFDATNGMCNITYRFAYIGHDEWIFQQLFNKICFNSVTYFTFTSSAKYRVLPLKKRTNNWKICIFWRKREKTQSFCLNRKKKLFREFNSQFSWKHLFIYEKSRNN